MFSTLQEYYAFFLLVAACWDGTGDKGSDGVGDEADNDSSDGADDDAADEANKFLPFFFQTPGFNHLLVTPLLTDQKWTFHLTSRPFIQPFHLHSDFIFTNVDSVPKKTRPATRHKMRLVYVRK